MMNLLEVQNLKTYFHTEHDALEAIDLSFSIKQGEILGFVGESGCGKSVAAQSILRLFDEKTVHYKGEIKFNGSNLLTMSPAQIQKVRGNDIAMIFQDPLSSLNPVYTIGNQIIETIRAHQTISKKEARVRSIELLRLVGIPIPEERIKDYPHQLSGGMRQRAMIAMALACEPKLLIADEPTTALDVTTQAQTLELILEINKKLNMSVMLITHDLGVVAEVCDRVVIMYLGQVVEVATKEELFRQPKHPYTKALMNSIPRLNSNKQEKLFSIKGSVPTLGNIPTGCRFSNRCPLAIERCKESEPPLLSVGGGRDVRCWLTE